MEHTEDIITMLRHIPGPAFLAEDGIVTAVNEAAQQHFIHTGDAVRSMLHTGQEEYSHFQSGCLYLTLRLCDLSCSASVVPVGRYHLFELLPAGDQAELRSMALAAQILRTPLSNVMTIADQLFPLTGVDIPEQMQHKIATINRGLYQLLRIVCNMSDAYRYNNETVFRGEIRDVTALIREICDRAVPLLAHADISLHYCGPSEPIYTLVDAEKLERGISNILSNSLKFVPKGGSVHVHLRRHNRMLYLTVQDNGGDFSQQAAGNIFDRYMRNPGLEDGRFGIGLGMVLIRNTAAVHGGTILLEQSQNQGLRLTMSLSIRRSSDSMVRSPILYVDYASEHDHLLLEFADSLPAELYGSDQI